MQTWKIWSLIAARTISRQAQIDFRRFEHLQNLLEALPANPYKIAFLLPAGLANSETLALLKNAPSIPVLWLLARNEAIGADSSAKHNPLFFWLQAPLRWREVQLVLQQAEKIQQIQKNFYHQTVAIEQNFHSRELAFYQALQRTEQKYVEMVENALIGIFETTPQGRFIMANQALANMLGYASVAELISQVQDIANQLYVNPKERDEFLQIIHKSKKNDGNLLQLKRKDGSVLWAFEHVQVVRAAKTGEIIAYRGTLEDVTRLKQTEERLLRSYQQQSVISKILELDLQPLTLQQKMQRTLQILLETDWLELSFGGAIFTRDTTQDVFVLQAVRGFDNVRLQIGKPISPEFCFCADTVQNCPLHASFGKKPPCELQIVNQRIFCLPLHTANQLLGGLILYATQAHTQSPDIVEFLQTVANLLSLIVERDEQQRQLLLSREDLEQKVQMRTAELAKINQDLRNEIAAREQLQHVLELELIHRAQTEQVLRESENKFRNIIQQSSDGITLTDETGVIIVWNAAMAKMTGIPTEQAINRRIWDVQFELGLPETKTQQRYEYLQRLAQQMLNGNDPGIWGKILEGQYILRSGEKRILQGTIFPIQTPRGIMLGSISRDITEIEQIKQTHLIQSAALNAAANGIVITDARGVITWVNPAFTQLTGYTAEEAIGNTPRLLKSGITPEEVYRDLWNTIQNGQVWRGELTNRRKDGSFYIQEMTITPVYVAGNQVSHFIAIQQDITQRRMEQERLERYVVEQSSLYQISLTVARFLHPDVMLRSVLDVLLALPHLTPDSAWVIAEIDPEVSPRLAAWRNPPPLSVFEQFSAHLLPEFGKMAQRTSGCWVENSKNQTSTFAQWLAAAGFEVSIATPIFVNQRVLGIFFLAWKTMCQLGDDVRTLLMTIGHQVGLALRNAQLYRTAIQYNRLKTLNEIATAVTRSLDLATVLSTIIQQVSNALDAMAGSVMLLSPNDPNNLVFAQIYPFNATYLLGKPIPLYNSIAGWVFQHRQIVRLDNARLDPRWYSEIDRMFNFSTLSLLSVPLMTQETVLGVIEIVNKRSGAFTQEDEELLSAVASIAAVAIENARLYERQKHLLQERERIQAHLIQTEKMSALGQLTASIAHEINNPLQAVRGFLDLLNEEIHTAQRPEKIDRYLTIVNQELARIAGIVSRMRDFYRSSGSQRVRFNVLHLLDSVTELLQKQFHTQQIEILQQVTADVTEIYANPDQLKQVFLNLFLNALDVMPDGGLLKIMVEIRPLNHIPALWITLHDSGPGIPTEVLPRLFEPFFTTKKHGSGLGLYICYEIMRDHQGSIQLENHPDGGCMVYLALPIT